MEGGTDYGIRDDRDPAQAPIFASRTTWSRCLGKAGISWRSYQEDIGAAQEVPVASHGL